MTKNTKRRLYYQKYLPGDIITWFNNDIYINEINLIRLVTGVVGFFGNFRYETVDLELGRSSEHRYYGERTNILVSNTDIVNSRLIFRSFPGISDIVCKEICKFSGECDLCNFKPSIRPNKFFFPGDKINSTLLISYPVNNRKGIVKRVRINESVLIDFVEELNEKSIVTLDFIKNRIKELVTLENLEYGVFMEYSSKEISHFSKNLRLFQRRGYTIDSGKLNYCSQCILSKDNCNECGIVKYNLLDNSKSLMI